MDHSTDESSTGPEQTADGTMGARIEYLARTLAEMEQGLRRVDTLDHHASRAASRRIRKVVHGARRARARSQRARTSPPKVRRSSYSHPSAGVTEGTVIIERDSRARAYCVRLEQEHDRWRIVELAPVDAGLKPAVTAASREGQLPIGEDGVRRSSGRDTVAFSAPPMPGDPGLVIEPDGTEAADAAHREDDAGGTDEDTGTEGTTG